MVPPLLGRPDCKTATSVAQDVYPAPTPRWQAKRVPPPQTQAPSRPHGPRVLVIQNDPDSGPGRLPAWIDDEGACLELVRAYAGERVPTSPDRFAAVLMLGGGFLPDADEEHPWLPDERALARAAVADGTPLLGICLGGQLLAHTFGGEVLGEHGPRERGVTDIMVRRDAADDPLLGPLDAVVPAVESHQDAITRLPTGAAWLASTESYPHQAFRLGDRAWGLQFHPEASSDKVRTWSRERLRQQGFDPDAIFEEADRRGADLESVWSGFVHRFLALTRSNRRVA